jgi:bis(5'-adenosyl)-triphosphatase
VPHVHFHVMPRGHPSDQYADEKNDEIYPALEVVEATLHDDLKAHHEVAEPSKFERTTIKMDVEDRKPRTMEEMETEARWLADFFRVGHDGGDVGTGASN